MRLGISFTLPHATPEEWAAKNRALGLGAVVFPVDHTAGDETVAAYLETAEKYDLKIAEVGAWKNLLAPDPAEKAKNYAYVLGQCKLAEKVGAACCVDISGACGEVWDGGYPGNYSKETFYEVVATAKRLIAEAGMKKSAFTLEPMPWMLPWDAESYLELIDAVGSENFAVHMDAINLMNSPDRYFHCADFLKHTFSLLSGRIRSVHVKDVALQRTLTLHLKEVPIGEGGFDIPTYARLAENESADIPFIIEHLGKEEEYLKAIEAVKGILEKEGIKLK